MVDELGGSVGIELGLGEDVGVADGHGSGGNGGEAGAGTIAGTRDDAAGVLVHELLGRSLDERLEGGGTVIGDLARHGSGGIGRAGSGSVRATAASQTKTGDSGKTASETEEGAARAGIIEHGSPFESKRAQCADGPGRVLKAPMGNLQLPIRRTASTIPRVRRPFLHVRRLLRLSDHPLPPAAPQLTRGLHRRLRLTPMRYAVDNHPANPPHSPCPFEGERRLKHVPSR